MGGYYLFNKNEQRKVLQKYIFNVNLIIEVLNMENNKKGLEKKRQKSNKKIWIIISIVIAILILGIVIYVIFLEYNCNKNNNKKIMVMIFLLLYQLHISQLYIYTQKKKQMYRLI